MALPYYFQSINLNVLLFQSCIALSCVHTAYNNNADTHMYTIMHTITPDLILIRQTVPGACKVCRRAINRLRNEHESSRSKPLAGVLSGKLNTRLQGRVCDGLWLDKKSLYLALHLETRLECGYHIFALSSLTTTFCVNSLLWFAGKRTFLHFTVIYTTD